MLRSPSGANGYGGRLRRIGAQHLHRVRCRVRRSDRGRRASGPGRRGWRVSRRRRDRAGVADGRAASGRPSARERSSATSATAGPAQLELDVVPRRSSVRSAVIERDRLRVAEVARVVVAAVTQVDATDERDVERRTARDRTTTSFWWWLPPRRTRSSRTTSPPAALTDFGETRRCPFAAKCALRGCERHSRPRTLDPAPSRSASTRPTSVPGPSSSSSPSPCQSVKLHRVAAFETRQHRVQPAEVLGAVDVHVDVVALGPRAAVVATTVDRRGGIPALLRGEEPVFETQRTSFPRCRIEVMTRLERAGGRPVGRRVG